MREVKKSMRLLFTVLFFITLACSSICISPLYAKNFKEMVVFGDSLSDTGNLYTFYSTNYDITFPAAPYSPGRFSNGLVWVEYLADLMDVERPAPSIEGGTNYAWGGAKTGDGNDDNPVDENALYIGEQIDSFLRIESPYDDPRTFNYPKHKQLLILWAGANDFFSVGVPTSQDIEEIVDNIIGHIRTLALNSHPEAPKLHFMVANLPPLGHTPKVQWLSFLSSLLNPNFDLAGYVDVLSVAFNDLLDTKLNDLKQELMEDDSIEINLYKLDIYTLFENILNNPDSFGFEMDVYETGVYNTVRGTETDETDNPGCPLDVTKFMPYYPEYGDGPAVAGVSLFFDDMHPTTVTHKIIAEKALELISGELEETLIRNAKRQKIAKF